jgi:hypothetical protein
MVVFLGPDRRRLEDLEDATRQYLAWKDISDRQKDLDLSPLQVRNVENRLGQADDSVRLRIPPTYVWVLVPVQPDPRQPASLSERRSESSADGLAERVSAKLQQEDLLRVEHAPSDVRRHLDSMLGDVWSGGHIQVRRIWEYYCAYPYLSRLRDRSVLDDAVRRVLTVRDWEHEGFALALGYDESTGRYRGLAIPGADEAFGQIIDTALLVRPDLARAQYEGELAARAPTASVDESIGEPRGPGAFEVEVSEAPSGQANVRFYGVYKLRHPQLYSKEFAKLGNEVIQHLVATEDVELSVTVDIQAVKRNGLPDDIVDLLKENASALKFDDFGIEDS